MGVVSIRSTEHTKLLILDDSRVVSIDHNDFVELVLAVLANPVRVENFEVWEVACNTLFSHALGVLGHGDFLDTGLGWLALHVNLTLSQSTTADSGSDEDDTLLCFVAKGASRIEASWAFNSAIDRFTAPLSHSGLPVHVRQCIVWALPSLTNVLVQSLSHDEHLRFSASSRQNSPL